jgi:predicted nucleic acid-binding protein
MEVLDTSVLIAGGTPTGERAAISVVSLAELHFGVLIAKDDEARAHRLRRLALVEARFPDPLPLDDAVAREWGRLKTTVAQRGGRPRRRDADLAIAATANVHSAALLTHDAKDLEIVADLVELRSP